MQPGRSLEQLCSQFQAVMAAPVLARHTARFASGRLRYLAIYPESELCLETAAARLASYEQTL